MCISHVDMNERDRDRNTEIDREIQREREHMLHICRDIHKLSSHANIKLNPCKPADLFTVQITDGELGNVHKSDDGNDNEKRKRDLSVTP